MKKICLILAALICIVGCSSTAYASSSYDDPLKPYENGSFSEVIGYYDGYTLHDSSIFTIHTGKYGWFITRGSKKEITIEFHGMYHDYTEATIRIPNRIYNGKSRVDVTGLNGSCGFRTFDVDPENNNLKCVDNVVFSKDGKTLFSYAKFDERTEYEIPDGTEVIGRRAFYECGNLETVTLPDSVNEVDTFSFAHMNIRSFELPPDIETIPDYCFYSEPELVSFDIPRDSKLNKIGVHAISQCYKLQELCLPSFDITIDKCAFGTLQDGKIPIRLKSYVQPEPINENNTLKWDRISNTSYYEIYQKLPGGEYKLLTTTKGNSCKLSYLKSGKEYIFAIKPIAIIPGSVDSDEYFDVSHFPETFTIEGTMSEDIVISL